MTLRGTLRTLYNLHTSNSSNPSDRNKEKPMAEVKMRR